MKNDNEHIGMAVPFASMRPALDEGAKLHHLPSSGSHARGASLLSFYAFVCCVCCVFGVCWFARSARILKLSSLLTLSFDNAPMFVLG